jgi:hypothetical protein
MRFRGLVCVVALLAVAGCAAPSVAPRPAQQQAAAAYLRDWNAVGIRIADEMERYALLPNRRTGAPADPQYRAFHIHVTSPGSAFLAAVRDSLETEILDRGGQVARLPAGATVINLEAHVVRWGADVEPGFDVLRPTTYSAEVQWQASIVTRDRVVLRTRAPIFVRGGDLALYRGDATIAALPSPGPDERLAVRTLRFTR